ncbi:unnamed protein product [Pelagomonas calceolata]|uniref:Uncharacterized protein n=1 Tax=Pelagomonas calceolata TaxID=35677 RepID=A0A7S3ZMS5_9STRA|nr:unnamed protein product [Pelagomonas calceolata]|mmetsp:Transcript_20333/g.60697  ORF Transcript_20333/g.60697 Transcript_20333/m.60697 type:complete len:258 (+) Transcript_20333:478-1251(+)
MGCCFPDMFGTKKGLLIGACTSCGLKDNPDEVHYIDDCLTCEEGFEIIPMFPDCTGLCIKTGQSVRTFMEMGFADLSTSACTAYLDCYGGDDRKAIKVLPTDGTNSFPWGGGGSYFYWSYSYSYEFESYSYGDDDFFDDDLYANIVCDGQTPDNYCDCGSGPLGDCEANPSFCACEEAQAPECCDGSAYSFSYGDVCVDGIIEVISGDHDGEGERCVQCDGQAPGDYCDCQVDCEESDNCDCAEAKGPTCCGEGGRD